MSCIDWTPEGNVWNGRDLSIYRMAKPCLTIALLFFIRWINAVDWEFMIGKI